MKNKKINKKTSDNRMILIEIVKSVEDLRYIINKRDYLIDKYNHFTSLGLPFECVNDICDLKLKGGWIIGKQIMLLTKYVDDNYVDFKLN